MHIAVQDIPDDAQGHPRWGRGCILGFSCEMKCPNEAVTTFPTWLVFSPFTFYNTRRAARYPQLDMAPVEQIKGKTRVKTAGKRSDAS